MSVLPQWMAPLVHAPVDVFVSAKDRREYCNFCKAIKEGPIHGPDAHKGDESIAKLRRAYFDAQVGALTIQQQLGPLASSMGIEIDGADLKLRRLEYILEVLLAGMLEPTQRLELEMGWARRMNDHLEEAFARLREMNRHTGLLVPQRPTGGLIVPGSN